MDQSKINIRYAQAYYSLAKEKGLTQELRSDARVISSVCGSIRDFILLIESPVIPTSEKIKAVKSIFEGKINADSLNFLVLIIENRREKYIPGILRELEALYRKDQGIKTALLTTAAPLDPEVAEQIRKDLESQLSSKIELNQVIDQQLIGGFVLRIDDSQYDASVATQLKKIKEKLLEIELK